MITELHYEGTGLSATQLSKTLDELWEELKKNSALRLRAQELGIKLDQLSHLERKEAITVEQKYGGLDPASTAIIVAFSPVLARILHDLWQHVFLPKIKQKMGEDALKKKED